MLEKIKLLLNKMNDDSADELLNTLISMCKEEAYIYCNLPAYTTDLDLVVVSMVVEKYNRIGKNK